MDTIDIHAAYIENLRKTLHQKVDALCDTENHKLEHIFARQQEIQDLTNTVVKTKYSKKEMPFELERKLFKTRIAYEKAALKQRKHQDFIDRTSADYI